MKIGVKTCCWLLCVVASLAVSIQVVDGHSCAREHTSLKIVGVPVADVLRRLGAKLEREAESKALDDYADHFDGSDANQDGKHTRKEFVENGRYLTPQARSGIFRAADGDGDGVVSKAEYVLNRIITDEAKAIVQGMDDDQDGLVTRKEFVRHATRLLSDRELAVQVHSALDANADGEIPIREYLRVWGQWARAGQKSAEERITARRKILKSTPKDKPTPAGEADIADQLARMLLKYPAADANRDGKLNEDEAGNYILRTFQRKRPNRGPGIRKRSLIDVYESRTFRKMPYRLMKPIRIEAGRRYPLVISLHGSGGIGDDNLSNLRFWNGVMAQRQWREEYPSFVLVPQRKPGGYWGPKPDDGRVADFYVRNDLLPVLDLIDEIKQEFPIDESRIYAIGSSGGGVGTWNILRARSDLFAAAIPVCGRFPAQRRRCGQVGRSADLVLSTARQIHSSTLSFLAERLQS